MLLTHEFNTVIDVIYNMPYNFSPAPKAALLTTKLGVLEEKEISRNDIRSYSDIARVNIGSSISSLNKLIYLRRLFEIEKPKGLGWQLLSNVFHKRVIPEYQSSDGQPNRHMTDDEILNATDEVRAFISDFNYSDELQKAQSTDILKALYNSSNSYYEKLQLYRIIFTDNHPNKIVRKFINECFHVENDYLFQLNPCEYDTIPQYIIEECNVDVNV